MPAFCFVYYWTDTGTAAGRRSTEAGAELLDGLQGNFIVVGRNENRNANKEAEAMQEHDAEWFKQRAREKRERDAGRRSYQKNRARRDLEELEALYQQIKRESRQQKFPGVVSKPRRDSVIITEQQTRT